MSANVYFVNASDVNDEKADVISQCDDHSQTQSEAQNALSTFWTKVMEEIKSIRTMDLKQQVLPLARIKKIMKLDEDVKMISAEAPLLFAKAAEIFIHELTLRAWIHTEDNKRRTLQRNDIAMAITKYDQFDFLIDIVPRDDIKTNKVRDDGSRSGSADQVQYYLQLAQQHNANLQNLSNNSTAATTATAATVTQPNTIQIVQPQQVQTVQVGTVDQNGSPTSSGTQQASVFIQQTSPVSQNQTGNIQIFQQIVTPNGEIQQIPLNLTPQQLQMVKMHVQGNPSQPVIIQAAPLATAQPQLLQVAPQTAGPQQVFLAQSNGNGETE
ncbi:nuclear transcription factor Y subunit gamma [Coccinella septempunctata]|uniref:nuclear transcription factor Y subunit gamma n=1 Tax=Coccinella septempunctata TaxID=41139 RepID=UPI001D07244A|nr:nuclear transcription factor Y subunit gamma [Coccinella septempunctata]